MAKMLDALERARLERQKKLEETASPAAASVGNGAATPEATAGADERTSEIATPNSANAPGSAAVLDEAVTKGHHTSIAAAAAAARGASVQSATGASTHGPGVKPRTGPIRAARVSNFHPDVSKSVIGAHDLQSPITEQLRQIRTNLDTILADQRSRTIVITSPAAGDGKSLIAANLATILAERPDQQVLLIDADLRKGTQHQLFGAHPAPGLSEVLRDQCPIEETLYSTSLPNLTLLPCGHASDHPTVLLGSDRMVTLLGQLQRSFQWIIIDTPPILPVTDALVLGRGCTGLILVVRMGQTARPLIERAQESLAEVRIPVLGCILNDFAQNSPESHYHRSYRQEDSKGGFHS